ncbi:hypothetical protein [Fervidibacillus halotolerans]|uniref:Uncharacterized protein n=1 Tax=Fervidibacillus halotolerans TaxID=2980027 RepID=A0A9E8RYJ6_9BACI|nr:hypothetical protein [Fervidibacillus halotolerans]WAA12269.1 hypothetical protein OE105_11995 [Fervidibacillus halotolerans]
MNDQMKRIIHSIDIPKELHQRTILGVSKAKKEMDSSKRRIGKKTIAVIALLLISIGTYTILSFFMNDDFQNTHVSKHEGIQIPPIQLPEKTTVTADMLGLIIYHGKIYTETSTEIEPEKAKALIGEKLGITKPTIDEWSMGKEEAYEEEFASNIGEVNVYSVKGYDQNFRIMAYGEGNGHPYAQFFENLYGITITGGGDLFGQLHLAGNVTNAFYRTFHDWDYNIDQYYPISNLEIVNDFIDELNETKPFLRKENLDPIVDFRTDEQFRELTIELADGSKVKLILFKDGYIYYGNMLVYFKMNEKPFAKMWNQLNK